MVSGGIVTPFSLLAFCALPEAGAREGILRIYRGSTVSLHTFDPTQHSSGRRRCRLFGQSSFADAPTVGGSGTGTPREI